MIAFEVVQPGDVLLFSRVKPTWSSRGIQRVQAKVGAKAQHAMWTHVAVALGGNDLLHADWPGGVRFAELTEFGANYRIRLRRPQLSETDRLRVALEATKMFNHRYAIEDVAKVGVEVPINRFGPLRVLGQARRAMTCSELYSRALFRATKQRIHDRDDARTYPFDVSASKLLVDEHLGWVSVPP